MALSGYCDFMRINEKHGDYYEMLTRIKVACDQFLLTWINITPCSTQRLTDGFQIIGQS